MSDPTVNAIPRWRGFNLIEMFSSSREWQRIFPYEDDGRLLESDFRLISSFGFDFVRIPMSYRFWNDGATLLKFNEAFWFRIDQALEWGEKYGLHVSLNIHRTPGYCINNDLWEPHGLNLWTDEAAVEAFCYYWSRFAERYRGIPSARLSFDLLNEPPWEKPGAAYSVKEAYMRVMRRVAADIRRIDPDRLLIVDGMDAGNKLLPELADLGVAQSCRGYDPFTLTHYRADWTGNPVVHPPVWPVQPAGGKVWHKEALRERYAPAVELMRRGVGVHCGEMGCHRETPHTVFLAWMRDLLEVLTERGIGYALWNFRGPFGVLNSGRSDVAYKSVDGYLVDAELLRLLQRY